MRIAVLHAWSSLGAAVVETVLTRKGDEVLIVGSPTTAPDPELVALGSRIAGGDLDASIEAFAPDVLLVATYPTKLSARVVAAARLGAFNVHPSLLPAYRGAQPEFWVVRNGESETGISIHVLTDRFDAGPVVARARIALGPHDTMETVCERLASIAPPAVTDVLDRLARGEHLEGEPQDESRVTRAPAVRPEHLVIRWTDSPVAIERLVRACEPWFDAVAEVEGRRVIVRRCSVTAEGAIVLDEVVPVTS